MINSKTKEYDDGYPRVIRFLLAIAIVLISFTLVSCPPIYRIPHFQFRVTDDHTPDPGIGKYNVGVASTTWGFNFRNDEHQIGEIRFMNEVPYFWESVGNVTWKSNIAYHDVNSDADFNWYTQYAVFAIPHSFMVYNYSGIMRGGPARQKIHAQSFSSAGLKGFSDATVVLTGWRFGFWGEDHPLAKIGVRLTDVNYDKNTGIITWNVQNAFEDKDGDDNYYWSYQYLVIALNRNKDIDCPVIRCNTFHNLEKGPGNVPPSVDYYSYESLNCSTGNCVNFDYENTIYLVQGWFYQLPEEEFYNNGNMEFCYAQEDTEIQKIALNYKALNFLDANLHCEFSPYIAYCDHSNEENCLMGIPEFNIDIVEIMWNGGEITYYPPDDWLNNGEGWRCSCEKAYEEKDWFVQINPGP